MSTAARTSSSTAGEYPAMFLPDLQGSHGSAGAAFRGLALAERLDQGMHGEEGPDRLAERARPLAVDEPDAGQTRDERIVEILLDHVARLVGRAPEQMQLGGHAAL